MFCTQVAFSFPVIGRGTMMIRTAFQRLMPPFQARLQLGKRNSKSNASPTQQDNKLKPLAMPGRHAHDARLDMDCISQTFMFFERPSRVLSQMSGACTAQTESDGFLLKSAGTAVVAAKGTSIYPATTHHLGCPPSLSNSTPARI